MNNGIAIYPGLDNTLEENLALIDTAAAAGITRVFTSMHIPESDTRALKKDIGTLLSAARAHHMEVISDVSPQTLAVLGLQTFTPSKFRMLGITTVRMDTASRRMKSHASATTTSTSASSSTPRR